MLSMLQIEDIRNMYFTKGKNVSEICRETGFDRKTVNKYLDKENWAEVKLPVPEARGSKLDAYKPEIDSWLEDDRKIRRKQRHTAKRVFDRLREKYPDFECSYRTVANYVSEKKQEIYTPKQSYLPLEHKAGEAQIDFGKADFVEKGIRFFGSYLSVSFPNSNGGYLQLFKGENFECLAQGLRNIFEHVGGVPHRHWYDNLSPVVKDILKGKDRNLTESFIRFREHYGFESVFCNPASGHEKGNVENKVGYLRRNLLVPVPEFSDLEEYNRELLVRCDKDMKREHYRKGEFISSLFEEDLKALNPLPTRVFEAESYEHVRVDAYGKFTLNDGKHTYSASPRLAGGRAVVVKSHNSIKVLDKNMKEVVVHDRLYGEERQESMDWLPYLSQLSKKPGALKYTGIYKMLPCSIRSWLDKVSPGEKSSALKMLASMTKESGFDVAVKSLENALSYNAPDFESISSVYRSIISRMPELKPVSLSSDVPELRKVDSDFSKYDRLFNSEVGHVSN